jgi:hypothetical protein
MVSEVVYRVQRHNYKDRKSFIATSAGIEKNTRTSVSGVQLLLLRDIWRTYPRLFALFAQITNIFDYLYLNYSPRPLDHPMV